jgi:hypothetical protein
LGVEEIRRGRVDDVSYGWVRLDGLVEGTWGTDVFDYDEGEVGGRGMGFEAV